MGSESSEKGGTHSVITGSADGGGDLPQGNAEEGGAPAHSASAGTSRNSWADAFDPRGAKEEGTPVGDGKLPEEDEVAVELSDTLRG